MEAVFLVVHLIVAVALVSVILLQRSEGGALGMGGGPGGLMSGRGAANLLSKTTTWLAAAFIGIAIILAILARQGDGSDALIESIEEDAQTVEEAPAPVVPDVPTDDQ